MKTQNTLASAALAMGLVACTTTPVASASSDGHAHGAASDLAPYPAARAGEMRHVIRLPAQTDEDGLKVELIVGKTMKVDCNNHVFGGQIQERTAEGWGYNYYVLENLGNAATTLMGCPPGSDREAFVRSSHQELVRYNSRLPVVVYAPADVEVRYRVWRAEAEQPAS